MTQEPQEKGPYRVTFLPEGKTIAAQDGETILDVAVRAGIELEHACGGCCACSTCHVHVRDAVEGLAPADDREEDMLDMAPGVTTKSRLACCATITGDVTVEVPAHNRNLVSEGR